MNDFYIQLHSRGIMFVNNKKISSIASDMKISLDINDRYLNEVANHIDYPVKEIVEILKVFNKIFPYQPERLSEKTPQGDAIV